MFVFEFELESRAPGQTLLHHARGATVDEAETAMRARYGEGVVVKVLSSKQVRALAPHELPAPENVT